MQIPSNFAPSIAMAVIVMAVAQCEGVRVTEKEATKRAVTGQAITNIQEENPSCLAKQK